MFLVSLFVFALFILFTYYLELRCKIITSFILEQRDRLLHDLYQAKSEISQLSKMRSELTNINYKDAREIEINSFYEQHKCKLHALHASEIDKLHYTYNLKITEDKFALKFSKYNSAKKNILNDIKASIQNLNIANE